MSEPRLVEWEGLRLKIRGDKAAAVARDMMRQQRAPIRDLELEFGEGSLVVHGKVEKILKVPFRVLIRRIEVRDNVVMVPIENMSAFGFLPLPKLLLHLAPPGALPPGVHIDAAASTIAVEVDRFLPNFLEAKVEEIRIVPEGLILSLGAGGADLPPEFGRP